jgi:hypothetical protein
LGLGLNLGLGLSLGLALGLDLNLGLGLGLGLSLGLGLILGLDLSLSHGTRFEALVELSRLAINFYLLIGMQYAIEGHGYRRSFSDFDWMLSGENAFAIKIKPTSNTAKVVRLSGERLTLRDSISTKQQLEKIFEQQPNLFQNQDQKEIQALQDYIRR